MTTQTTELITTLSLLGLQENEARVYLAAVELGTGSVWDIAKSSGVKRPTCYVILEKLAAESIAYRSSDVKRTVYSVVSPKELIATFTQRAKVAEQKLSELEAVANKAAYKPAIRLYEGVDGVKKIYELAIAESNSEVLVYGTGQVLDALPGYFEGSDGWTQRRAKKKRELRLIFADIPKSRHIQKINKPDDLRSVRYFPKDIFNPEQEVLIFDNYIAYVAILDKQPFATLIESRLFADFEKQRFEIMWKVAKT